MHIYEKYIKTGAVLEVGSIPEQLREEWEVRLIEMRENKHFASDDVLDAIQHVCFNEMYLNTFIKFNKTPKFRELKDKLDGSYVASEPKERKRGAKRRVLLLFLFVAL